jgi:hypothetical protein
MTANASPRSLAFIWATVLVSPFAWGASLVSMFWLTHPVCQGLSRLPLVLTGAGCTIAALAASGVARRALKRLSGGSIEHANEVLAFLLCLARWSGLVFALVIALSLVPTAILTPCTL